MKRKYIFYLFLVVGISFGFLLTRMVRFSGSVTTRLYQAIERCQRDDTFREYIKCFRSSSAPASLVKDYGIEVTMAALEELYDGKRIIGKTTTTSCHDVAHVIGEAGIKAKKRLASVIASCGTACGYGCVHGAIDRAVQQGETISKVVDECRSVEKSGKPKALLVACQHGLGHGIAEANKLDMESSLAACDIFTGDDARMDCGRGVLMEIFDSPVLSHPRSELPEDIISFCKTLPGVYATACAANAGSREYARSLSIDRAIGACASVGSEVQHLCYHYLGQSIYFWQQRSVIKGLSVCRQAPKEMSISCREGLLWSVASYRNANDAQVLCDTLELKDQTHCREYYEIALNYFYGANRDE